MRSDGDDDLREPDGEPRPAERKIEAARNQPYSGCVYADGTSGRKPNVPVDERHGETVALVDEFLEDRFALAREHEQPRDRGHGDDESRRRPLHLASTPMGATSRERYAVVSCHVERPLDDAVWARFSALQEEGRAASRSPR